MTSDNEFEVRKIRQRLEHLNDRRHFNRIVSGARIRLERSTCRDPQIMNDFQTYVRSLCNGTNGDFTHFHNMTTSTLIQHFAVAVNRSWK